MSIIASAILAATIPATTNLAEQVAIMWTAHTNRIAIVEARKEKNAERKSAIERVKNNVDKRKRRSVMPKSAGGVR